MDWNKIKTEYITTNISYRDLANKYNVSMNALFTRAKKEKWTELKKQNGNKMVTQSVEKANKEAIDYKSLIYSGAMTFAKKLSDFAMRNDVDSLAAIGMKPKDITGAFKDLEDILHIKSDSDLKEQEARIKKLQKEIEDDTNNNFTVTIQASSKEEIDEYTS